MTNAQRSAVSLTESGAEESISDSGKEVITGCQHTEMTEHETVFLVHLTEVEAAKDYTEQRFHDKTGLSLKLATTW